MKEKLFLNKFLLNTEVDDFFNKCETETKTKRMLNRVAWLSGLADAQKYDAVKVFFLIAMAEVIIKLKEKRFQEYGENSNDVRKFFNEMSQDNKQKLENSFVIDEFKVKNELLDFDTIKEVFLNIRHRLSHGKDHYSFQFHDGTDTLFNPLYGWGNDRALCELKLTYSEFRKIMITTALDIIKLCF